MEKFDPKKAAQKEAGQADGTGNAPDTDKSHAESMASDIFGMIEAALQSDLGVNEGFQNRPLATRNAGISYLFLPRQEIVAIPGVPDSMKRQVRLSNVLGVVDEQGKVTGIHLLCALDVPFDKVTGEAVILEHLNLNGVDGFTRQLRTVLAADLAANVPDASVQSDSQN